MALKVFAQLDRAANRRIRRSLNNAAKNLNRAASRAANRSATSTVSFFSRETRKQVYVKAARLKRNTRIRRARPSNATAFIDVRGAHIPLIDMGAPRQTRRGVTVRRYRNEGRQLIESGFITRVRAGGGAGPNFHRGVFRRRGDARLPIDQQFGPSVMALWQKRERRINAHALNELQKQLAQQIQFYRGRR